MNKALIAVIGLLCLACHQENASEPPVDERAQEIVDRTLEVHGLDAWRELQDVHFRERRVRFANSSDGRESVSERDIYLKRNTDGRLMVRIEAEGGRLERLGPDGFPHGGPLEGKVVMGYDGENYWEYFNGERVTDPEALRSTRFVVDAWSYWFCVPFILADDGVLLRYAGEDTLDGAPVHLVEVTFEPGTGENPDDRYMYYINRDTFMVENLRYWLRNRDRHREFRMREYIPVGGFLHDTLRLYHNHQGEHDGFKEMEILSVNSGLPDDLFRPGEEAALASRPTESPDQGEEEQTPPPR